MNEIMVSIVCLTYNHEEYIQDALRGFMMQEVNFNYEIIVHDDASVDRSVEISQKYEEKYPDRIKVICQKENQYIKKKNFMFLRQVYETCKGKYIALCEGDDFWIDRHKLQIQVDFLEENSDYVLVSHNAIRMNCSNYALESMNPYDCNRQIRPEEILMQYNGNIPTASIVLRKDVLMKMDDMYWECDVEDWPFQLFCITQGNVYYFDRIMSIYRYSHKGSWTASWEKDFDKTFEHCIKMIAFLSKYRKYKNDKYDAYIVTRIQRYVFNILNMITEEKKIFLERKCMEFNVETKQVYNVYTQELERVFRQTFKMDFFDEKLKSFIRKNKHIVIFGAGDYAGRLTIQLASNNIYFDGYLVSDLKCGKRKFMNKQVWDWNNMPFSPGEVGIVVAIRPVIWNQLIEILRENKIRQYICPFLFEIDDDFARR